MAKISRPPSGKSKAKSSSNQTLRAPMQLAKGTGKPSPGSKLTGGRRPGRKSGAKVNQNPGP